MAQNTLKRGSVRPRQLTRTVFAGTKGGVRKGPKTTKVKRPTQFAAVRGRDEAVKLEGEGVVGRRRKVEQF